MDPYGMTPYSISICLISTESQNNIDREVQKNKIKVVKLNFSHSFC